MSRLSGPCFLTLRVSWLQTALLSGTGHITRLRSVANYLPFPFKVVLDSAVCLLAKSISVLLAKSISVSRSVLYHAGSARALVPDLLMLLWPYCARWQAGITGGVQGAEGRPDGQVRHDGGGAEEAGPGAQGKHLHAGKESRHGQRQVN